MAKNNKSFLQDTFEIFIGKVYDFNNEIIKSSEELVEGTITTGGKWQKLFAQNLKKGAVLFGKQQELTLDTLEAMLAQYKKGDVRFRKLFDLEDFSLTEMFKELEEDLTGMANNATKIATSTTNRLAKRAIATVQETVAPMTKNVKEARNTVAKTATKTVNEVKAAAKVTATTAEKKTATAKTTASKTITKAKTATAKVGKTRAKVAAKASKTIAKTVKPAAAKAKVATKATAKVTAKPVAKKATTATVVAKPTVAKKVVTKPTAKVATKKVATKKAIENRALTTIEGIGPKIQELLNAAGIMTFEHLAKSEPTAVKEILLAAGSRYKMHNPATWSQQAVLAAASKWDELKTLQASLKGGKVVK